MRRCAGRKELDVGTQARKHTSIDHEVVALAEVDSDMPNLVLFHVTYFFLVVALLLSNLRAFNTLLQETVVLLYLGKRVCAP